MRGSGAAGWETTKKSRTLSWIMETLGHSQISLTMNTYAHVIAGAAARGGGQDGRDSEQVEGRAVAVITFLMGVALGLAMFFAIRHIGGWLNKPILEVQNKTIRLWLRGRVIELTADGARTLADDLVRRAKEVEVRSGLIVSSRDEP